MKALRLALAFVRIPRFFLSLLLGPLFIGLIIVSCQATMLYAYTFQVTKSGETFRAKNDRLGSGGPARFLLYGDKRPLAPLKTYRWLDDSTPPSGCEMLPYDVVIRVDEPASFDARPFEKFFEGTTRQLHICRDCVSEIVVNTRDGARETHIRSLFGALIPLVAKEKNQEINELVATVWDKRIELKDMLGTNIIHLPGTKKPINETLIANDIVILMNIVILVVVGLWLALRSHRKVLDYFARNGALLPLVAANGKRTFYSSIWIITLFRVILFLGSSVPVTCFVMMNMMDGNGIQTSITMSFPQMAIWLIGLVASLALLTLLGSIAELKHRSPISYICFKYVPIAICLVGGVSWLTSLAIPGSDIEALRTTIAVLPITGLFPLLFAPLLDFNENVIAAHIIIATLSVVFLMYKNARWFAAHLEEL